MRCIHDERVIPQWLQSEERLTLTQRKLTHQAAAEILLPRRPGRQVVVNERARGEIVPHQRLACQT
jgi:hypothetical protein